MHFIRDFLAGILLRVRIGTTHTCLAAMPVLLLACVAANSVAAAAADLDKVVLFNIKAQSLEKALLQFGAQAHVQISLAWNPSMASLKARELKGNYTGNEALSELLKGTSLRYVARRSTVAILPIASVHPVASKRRTIGSNARFGVVTSNANGDASKLRDPPEKQSKEKRPLLEEVVITGSRLLTTSKEETQEVEVYDLEEIEQSGQTSISDFLTTLPSVSLASRDTASGTVSTVNLRGLPVGTTLVLLNGRRLEESGLAQGEFFDLNDIPLAMVQKIEVNPNGSSAVYGSDAIAGVVNIILKTDFSGFAANAKYGWAKGSSTVDTSLGAGKQWSRGGISIIGSYEIDGALSASDRFLTASNDYDEFGGPDNNYPVCFPGNVFSLTGAPLPGAPAASGATYAAVAGARSSGKPSLSDFNYGALNDCSIDSGYSVLPSRHRAGVLVEAHFQIVPDVELFTEMLYTHVKQEFGEGDAELFGISGYQQFTVSASNPYNPFDEAVGVAEALPSAPLAAIYETDFFRPLVGIKGALARRWQWEVSAWQSADWDEFIGTNELPNDNAIQDALNSSDPTTALNPFVNGPIASQPVIQSLFNNSDISEKLLGRDDSAEAYIRGPVLALPAGSVDAVIGGDYVRSTLSENLINDGVDPPNTRLTYERRYGALFGEARIPLIGRLGPARDHFLTLTLAGRHDHYSDFGSANTYDLGLELRPTGNLLVRATYADAFEAPTVLEASGADTTAQTLITDPVTRLPILIPVVTGGDSKLSPMTGRSHTLGAVYSSDMFPGLVVSVTQWNVAEADVIQTLEPQLIVNNAGSFPGRVIRNSAGAIVEVIATDANFGSINVGGIDYQLDFTHSAWRGTWWSDLDGTETYHYRQALVPGTSPIESVGQAEDDADWAPRWKVRVGTGWKDASVAVYLDGRYTSSYFDYDSTERIGNYWVFDTNVRWSVGQSIGNWKWTSGSYIEAGATNLFNRAPQFSNFGFDYVGFDEAQESILGRSLYVNIGVKW